MKLSLKIEDASAADLMKFLDDIGYDKSIVIEQVQAHKAYLEYKHEKIEEMVSNSFPPQYNPEPEDYAHARINQTVIYEDSEFIHAIEWVTQSDVKLTLDWIKN